MRSLLFLLTAGLSLACGTPPAAVDNNNVSNIANTAPKPAREPLPVYTYEVVNSFPHDPRAFTQGLMYYGGMLYESTGQYGESTIRKVELTTGRVVQQSKLSEDFFGEGITLFGDKIYQITWREGTTFVYNLADMKLVKELRYNGEGWGLTNDDKNLIMSDGTHVIRFIDAETFRTARTIVVNREDGRPLMNINELEFVKGEIWANIWHSEEPQVLGRPNTIARIDPATGKLLGYIDLAGISPEDERRNKENTLNGIAYDAEGDRIFVTGKRWRKLFEIKVVPKQ
ncbi:glutaminyl-peptide cyclotransferase [soil metagenome]